MRRRRFPFGLVLPALLIALVAVFAALQYRWLGQVSEADREQMRRAIAERARQFADDFDREVSAAHAKLQVEGDVTDANAGARQAQRMEHWRASVRFPEMVRSVYAVSTGGELPTLYRFSAEQRTFDPIEWPESLAPVRTRLPRTATTDTLIPAGTADGFVPVPMARLAPVVLEVPALVIPPGPSGSVYTIVEFDGDAIRRRVLPALAAQHLLQAGSGDRFAILDQKGETFLSSGPGADHMDSRTADTSAALFRLQTDALSTVVIRGREVERMRAQVQVSRLPSPPPAPPAGTDALRVIGLTSRIGGVARPLPTWTLLLQHPAGSIDTAVSAARRRNLWLSFGILAVLTTGVALVLINARRSQQLAAQQMDFVATVSHELRTPVAVMRSAAQNLSAGVVHDPERAQMYGELIETEGRRLTDMLEQVLEFSGLDSHRPATPLVAIDPAAIAVEAVAACQPLIESHRLTIDVQVPGPGITAPVVMGHPDSLRRAVTNLLTNAVKHGGDGGWIGLEVRQTVERGKSAVVIAVSDRGRGVDALDLPKLFEPFFRGQYATDQQIQGSGLGLSLVRRIAEAYGGSVRVDSSQDQGATFSIHLPAVESSGTEPAVNPAPAGLAS